MIITLSQVFSLLHNIRNFTFIIYIGLCFPDLSTRVFLKFITDKYLHFCMSYYLTLFVI